MAELSGHLAGACSGRRAEAFDLHISDSGRIPLKEQAGIVLKTSHNPVLSLAQASFTTRLMPFPSLPMTITVGIVISAS